MSIHPQFGVRHNKRGLALQILFYSGHSCQDYIYSLGTLYGALQPFAICKVTTALAYL